MLAFVPTLFLSVSGWGQVLVDDFTRSNSTTVGNSWTETETVTAGAQIVGNQLQLGSTTSGVDYAYRDMNGVYPTTFSTQAGLYQWAFNVRSNRATNLNGFASGNYGWAFVLGATGINLYNGSSNNGYMVSLGGSANPDPVVISRFTNGVAGTATAVVTSSTTYSTGSDYFSVRVTFAQSTNTWTLFVESSTTGFPRSNPLLTSTSVGSATNNTYTSSNLRYMGPLWSHGTSSENCVFDDIYRPGPTLAVSGTSAFGTLCQGTASSGTTFTLTNTGVAPVTTVALGALSGTNPGDFAVSGLSSTTINAGGTATFSGTFTPTAGGARAATVNVTSTAPAATYAISGTGTAWSAPPAPTANTATSGTTTTATLGGTTSAATCPTTLTDQGVVYSSSNATPTVADTKVSFSNLTTGVKTVGVTGLTPGTRYYYRAYAINSGGTTYAATVGQFNTRSQEPTNHVSGFASSAQTTTTLTFTWTDNAGAAAADSFLVRLSATTPTVPTDNVTVTPSAMDVFVAPGVQTVTFSGLTMGTQYTAAIYPLVNTGYSGSTYGVDYKTTGAPSVSVFTVYNGTPAAGDLAFTAVQTDATNGVEFVTLRRLDLRGLNITDNGVLNTNALRTGEGIYTFPSTTALSDVPAGTVVRLTAGTGTNDLDPTDGVMVVYGNGSVVAGVTNFTLTTSGDQVIAYTGTTSAPTYMAGIAGAGASWNTGATSANNSKTPSTGADYYIGAVDNGSFTGSVTGAASSIRSAAVTSGNWSTSSSAISGLFNDKNILFDQPNYSSGSIGSSNVTISGATLNLAGLVFASTTTSATRYLAVLHAGTPGTPADRYTNYTGTLNDNAADYSSDPTVVTSATSPTNGTAGNGKVLYLGYSLPSALAVTGLNYNTSYTVAVYAVNGNGWSANYGTASTLSFTTPGVPMLTETVAAVTYASGSTYAFGTVESGTFLERDFVLTNNGSAAMTISSIATTGIGFSITSGASTTSLAVGASATVRVRYTPSAFSLQTGTLDVVSNSYNASTYTVNLTGTGMPSSVSDVIASAAYTYNATINYLSYQSASITSTANSIDVFQFTVRDGGGASDNDALPTILNAVTFSSVQGIGSLRAAALFNGSTLVSSAATINTLAGTIAFSGLSGANVTAADNGSVTLTLRVSFNTTVTDNQAITVSIANADVAQAGSNTSSDLSSFATVASNATKNKIVVTGNRIGFATQPTSYVGLSSNFVIGVEVEDANGNRDLDVNTGTVTLTKLTGSGTLSGTLTGTIASGLVLFTNLQLNQTTTGVTIQASLSPTLSPGPNVIVTNSFEVSPVGYSIGAYRTKSGATDWGTASNWEVLQSDNYTWQTAGAAPNSTTAEVHVETSISSSSTASVSKLYVKGTSTTLTINAALDVIGTTGEFRILSGKAVLTDAVSIRNTAGSSAVSTGKLTVDSLATLVINYSCDNGSNLWQGVENFKGGSVLEIQDWAWFGTVINDGGSYTVTANSAGYKFGKVIFNVTGGTFLSALATGSSTVNFCKNDFVLQSNGILPMQGSFGSTPIVFGGNLVNQGVYFALYASTSSATMTSTVKGDLQLWSGTLDINLFSNSSTNPRLVVHGNYSNTGTAEIRSSDGGALVQFDGDRLHTVMQTTSDATPNVNIGWQVTSGDSLRILSQNWTLSDGTSLTILNGGTMDFSSNGSGAFKVVETSSSNVTSFAVQAGGKLIITDPNGITSSGATGNVQTDTRTFDPAAHYHYKTYAGFTQNPGSGLPTTLTGTLTWEGFSNAQALSLASSITINSPGKLVVRKGSIAESATAGQPIIDGSGGLDMSEGILTFNRVGAGLTVPRLTGTYNLTGGTINLNGASTSSTNIQQLRGGVAYYNIAFGGSCSGTGYKSIASAATVQNNVTILTGEVVDLGSNSLSGAAGLTMSGGTLRSGNTVNPQPELTATATGQSYALTGGTIELYGTSASQRQTLRVADGNSNAISYYKVLISASAANASSGNADLAGSVTVTNDFRVNAPAYLNLDAGEAISGAGTFALTNGSGLRFADAYGIKTSGTAATDGHVRVTGTRTFPTQATYVAAGSAASATFGNAIPVGVDSVIINRSSGDISTSGFALKVGRKLRFASASKIQTGTDTVTLDATASVVGEATDRYVVGLLKVYRTVSQNSFTDFGGSGFAMTAFGAAPGYMTSTRRTGLSSTQTGFQNNQSVARYYDIHAATNTGLDATLTFGYFDGELNSAPEALLSAFRSQDGGATWTKFSAIARNPSQNFIRVKNVPGFSRWTLGNDAAPLPVDLVRFGARVDGEAALLSWNTASESNNAGFEVQRSADGRSYAKIGWVEGKGEAGASYSFRDAGFSGKAYYRLRQVDRDGKATESQSVYLSREKMELATAKLFPMPVSGRVTLHWAGQEETVVTANLIGTDGRLLFEGTGTTEQLSLMLTEVLGRQTQGVYQLQLRGEAGAEAFVRVIK